MDEKAVVDQLYNLLEPGGGLFIVGGGGVSILNSQDQNLQPKDLAIKHLVIKYLGPARRAGNLVYKPSGINWQQDLFPNSKFGKFKKQNYVTKVVRDLDQRLGNLYSLSWARRGLLGPKIDQFGAEFRGQLEPMMPAKGFMNVLNFEAFFLKR